MSRWWIRITSYALPYWRGLSLATALMLAGVVIDALKPWPLKLIIDYVLPGAPLPGPTASWITGLPSGGHPKGLLAWLAASTLLLFLSRKVVGMTRRYIQAGVASRMVYGLSGDLFDRIQRQSLQFHGRHRCGDLIRRVTADTGCVRELVIGVYLPVLTSLASLAVMFAVMWHLDRLLSLIAVMVAIPLGVLIRLFARPMTERMYEQQVLQGRMMSLAEQTLTALPMVQAFGSEQYEDDRFRSISGKTLRAHLRALVTQIQFKVGISGTTAIGTAGVMSLGGLRVLQGHLSVGDLIVFLSYLASLYAPMETLAYLSSGFASSSAKSRRVLAILDQKNSIRDAPDAQPLPTDKPGPRGHICFDAVTFGYEPDRPVLRDVSLEVYPGEMLALVGPTGAGKSTLVSMIARFADPWRGCVRFDGRDVRSITLASLRDQIAWVPQEPFLLPLTVADNIAYGCPAAGRQAIQAAAVAANADSFIQQLPQGYETVIGERGVTLSGGQRQRLVIARAVLKDAPVLLLDEPTSALDAKTESLLLDALDRLMEGRTTLVVAHRLSTIRRANRIAVLQEGRVVERGTHTQLMAANGSYRRLHETQFDSMAVGRPS